MDSCKIELLKKTNTYSKNKGEYSMRDVAKNEEIIVEILKKCNWRERIIVKKNKKLILNVYHEGRIKASNSFYN